MKKIYILALLVSFSGFVFAQKLSSHGAKLACPSILSSVKTPTDTLIPYGVANNTGLTIYTAASGGYVMGTNGYGDLAKAQAFTVTASYNVEEILIWAGAKAVNGTGNDLIVSLNNMDGPGESSTGPVTNAPNTQITSVTISMLDVDTLGGFTIATFPSPVTVYSDYAVVLDFSSMGTDEIGMVTCMDGDPGTTETAWEKWSDDVWHSVLEAWSGLTIDMVTLVVVDQSTAGIGSENFFDGIKFSAYPNPAINSTKIQYEIANQADVQMDIIDITGKVVMSLNEGNQSRGQHSVVINTEKMNSGSYFVSLKANGKRLTKRLTINK